jgi:hypothetical protein
MGDAGQVTSDWRKLVATYVLTDTVWLLLGLVPPLALIFLAVKYYGDRARGDTKNVLRRNIFQHWVRAWPALSKQTEKAPSWPPPLPQAHLILCPRLANRSGTTAWCRSAKKRTGESRPSCLDVGGVTPTP